MEANFDDLYGAAEVGRYLGIGKQPARWLMQAGIIPSARLGLNFVSQRKVIDEALKRPLGELLRAAGREGA